MKNVQRRGVGMINEIEKRLWNAADQLRANSRLKSSEYSVPVLGLIFLRFADYKFTLAEQEIDFQRMLVFLIS
ncbi:MAG: type I restriction-modification system subunit M N-terminal domain-containing protein [Methanophagales archaeon]|nr:type I restriction-modification system subunit M N-terminal domain-containing protein [Methanophagales archaeon]